jgi:hypothetical protein
MVSTNYTWESKGTYHVKVKTMDVIGPDIYDNCMESEWSDPLEVSMTKTKIKIMNITLLLHRLFNRFLFFEKMLNQII